MKSILNIAPLLLASAGVVLAGDDSYKVNAICTSDQMMRYYQTEHDGLWGGSWWQSANLMAALADISALDSDYATHYSGTFDTTYQKAPSFNGYTGFLDEYYDDEGWWGNAWLAAYDLTGKEGYLNLAISIYNDISGGKSSCGGIYWEKNHAFVAAIANELYISLAAGLANRVSSDKKQTYVDAATSIWDWFFHSGLVDSKDGLVMDGMDNDTCTASGKKYSYNQGVILGAAAELYKATGNKTVLEQAGSIADATTKSGSALTSASGVLTDCSSGCDIQSEMFKGPLFRGLRKLQLVYPHDSWVTWITTNAKSLWNHALNVTTVNGNSECNTGDNFAGPMSKVNEVTQGAALDCLLAAWTVTK